MRVTLSCGSIAATEHPKRAALPVAPPRTVVWKARAAGFDGHPREQPIAHPLKKARHPALILFGQAVRERRRALGHSQEGFAYAASMDRGYVGGLERGAHNTTLLTVLKVIGALGMTPSQFFAAFDDGPTNANAAGPLLVKTSASAPNDRGRNHP